MASLSPVRKPFISSSLCIATSSVKMNDNRTPKLLKRSFSGSWQKRVHFALVKYLTLAMLLVVTGVPLWMSTSRGARPSSSSSEGTIMASAQYVTEIYETCSAIEGEIARCGPGSNCFIINGIPSCQCIVDITSGLPLAGNPYKACTWDISGIWQLYSYIDVETGFYREILSPASNEPFVIRLDRTDALLKTCYMIGAIFIVTALTSFSLGVCTRAFLDARDNTSIIFEQAEGFLDQGGRSILLRTNLLDTAIKKVFPKKAKKLDKWDVKGQWQKTDGHKVDILDLKKPKGWPLKSRETEIYKNYSAFWYNDAGYGAALLRLSMALFLDKTLPTERHAFNTNARFVQVGWYGALLYGSSRVDLYSPADGRPIFTLLRQDMMPPFTPFGTGTNLTPQENILQEDLTSLPDPNVYTQMPQMPQIQQMVSYANPVGAYPQVQTNLDTLTNAGLNGNGNVEADVAEDPPSASAEDRLAAILAAAGIPDIPAERIMGSRPDASFTPQ